MHTMHPTLLIGPSDWDRLKLPREEFDARMAALWQDHWQAGGAIIYGNARDHAALAYLTHFTPKLEAALALIPREGEPQLLVGGGVNMLTAAKPLTFVEHLAPLRGAAEAVADWATALAADSSLVLIGGETMPFAMRRGIETALGEVRVVEPGDAALRARMRIKSPREVAAIREALEGLQAALTALTGAHRAGRSVIGAVLMAEHAALRLGAQDVRSLFSLDHGRTLRPFAVPVNHVVDPLQVYLAVRHTGYWAEGFVWLGSESRHAAQAASALRTVLGLLRAGRRRSEVVGRLTETLGAGRPHPAAVPLMSLGLSLDDLGGDDDVLLPNEVLSLRAGLQSDRDGAVLSAMVQLTADGAEVLWAAPGVLGGAA